MYQPVVLYSLLAQNFEGFSIAFASCKDFDLFTTYFHGFMRPNSKLISHLICGNFSNEIFKNIINYTLATFVTCAITSDSIKCNLESLIYLFHEKKDLIRGNFHSMAKGNLNKSKETM